MKMRFFTKYDLPDRLLREFDRHDNVDRLSYCDNTLMIQRFMEAGKNLKYTRAQALYADSDALKDSKLSPMPVFQEDPVETADHIAAIKSEIASQVSKLNPPSEPEVKRSETDDSDKVQPPNMKKSPISNESE